MVGNIEGKKEKTQIAARGRYALRTQGKGRGAKKGESLWKMKRRIRRENERETAT